MTCNYAAAGICGNECAIGCRARAYQRASIGDSWRGMSRRRAAAYDWRADSITGNLDSAASRIWRDRSAVPAGARAYMIDKRDRLNSLARDRGAALRQD